MPGEFLTRSEEVEALAAEARASGRIGLDTEFLWERTYAPRLCLVQIACAGRVALVDPVEGAPLEPIAELVEDPSVEVVMHAPSADMLAFALRYGTRPTRIFDTQLVAGFVGLTATASLERLLRDALKVELGHHESFSDWSRRPLTPTQRAYAQDDVRHLLPLADDLAARLQRAGREAWARDELARRVPDGADVTPDPREAWRKVARRGRLNGRQLAVLASIAAWRERTARTRDLPAQWVMRDPTLVEIARSMPASVDDLRRVRGAQLRSRDAQELLEAIAEGGEAEPVVAAESAPPAAIRRADAASGLASAVLRVRCADADIASELVATRGQLDDFLQAVILGRHASHDLANGWRRELVGDELVALVEGRIALSLKPKPPYLAIHQVDGTDVR
jgi:ribonuclease D